MFAPRYFAPRYFAARYNPPSGQELTGVTDYLYKRDANIYISKGTSITANANNTTLLNVTDFSFNRNTISTNKSRDTLNPTQERVVETFIEAISPVDFSFTTYIKPILDTNVTSPEENLWVGLLGVDNIVSTSAISTIDFSNSNIQTLNELTIWIDHPNKPRGSYRLDNVVIDKATIDFSIKDIAKVSWEGRALSINQDGNPPNATDRTNETGCLKNKLSTISLSMNYVDYNLPLIGGSLTIDNNNIFYGRAKLGETTVPEGHYSGNRTIIGNLQFYSKSGVARSSALLNTLYSALSSSIYESSYLANFTINIAGTDYPYITINIPSSIINSGNQDFSEVISTNIEFIAQESAGNYTSIVYYLSDPAVTTTSYFPEDYFPETYYPATYYPY